MIFEVQVIEKNIVERYLMVKLLNLLSYCFNGKKLINTSKGLNDFLKISDSNENLDFFSNIKEMDIKGKIEKLEVQF